MIKTCLQCNSEFSPVGAHRQKLQVYCSKSCRNLAGQFKYTVMRVDYPCPACGVTCTATKAQLNASQYNNARAPYCKSCRKTKREARWRGFRRNVSLLSRRGVEIKRTEEDCTATYLEFTEPPAPSEIVNDLSVAGD